MLCLFSPPSSHTHRPVSAVGVLHWWLRHCAQLQCPEFVTGPAAGQAAAAAADEAGAVDAAGIAGGGGQQDTRCAAQLGPLFQPVMPPRLFYSLLCLKPACRTALCEVRVRVLPPPDRQQLRPLNAQLRCCRHYTTTDKRNSAHPMQVQQLPHSGRPCLAAGRPGRATAQTQPAVRHPARPAVHVRQRPWAAGWLGGVCGDAAGPLCAGIAAPCCASHDVAGCRMCSIAARLLCPHYPLPPCLLLKCTTTQPW